MKGLTLTRPWPWAIVHAPPDQAKRIENRDWKPRSILRQRFAIHSGLGWDQTIAGILAARFPGLCSELETDHPDAVIVGVATVIGVVSTPGMRGYDAQRNAVPQLAALGGPWPDQARWFMGTHGWLLEDVHALATPVQHMGGRGLWTVHPTAEMAILSQLAA